MEIETDRRENATGWRNAFAVQDAHDAEVTRIESEAFAAVARKMESK